MLNELGKTHIQIASLHEEKEILQANGMQLESPESGLAKLEWLFV